MSLALIIALQTAATPIPPDFDLARVKPIDSDLRTQPGSACAPGEDGEIVVCGRRPGGGDYPLEAMGRLFATRPLVAEIGLGGTVTGRAYVEQVGMDRGAVSNRAMIGIRMPF